MLRLLLGLLLACTLCACNTLNHRDLSVVDAHGVSQRLYRKMARHEPLTLDEIVELSQKHVPGALIVRYLQPTYYVYNLTGGDVVRLKQAGVEPGVIQYLQATPTLFSPSHAPVWYEDNPRIYDTHPGLYPY